MLGFGYAKQLMKSAEKNISLKIRRIVVSKASEPVQQRSVHSSANALLVLYTACLADIPI